MVDAYTGEIRIFCGKFEPRNWAFCNGQLLNITSNTVLYSILHNKYGGDGKTTFALPNLNGRVAIHQGIGTGLTPRNIGSVGGSSTVTLLTSEMPNHTHIPNCNNFETPYIDPREAIWTEQQGRSSSPVYAKEVNKSMSPLVIGDAGGSQPHNNMQPYLGLNFIICLNGELPSRS